MALNGMMTALVTPFEAGRPDLKALERLVEWQIDCGIDGLVPCGTTGEAPTLSEAEWRDVVQTTIEVARGRVPIVAGTGSNSTAGSVQRTVLAAELGADAALVVTPYYNKPTQGGLVAHFTEVAQAGLPILLYNVPGRTGVSLSAESVGALAKLPNVAGIKEASADMGYASDLLAEIDDKDREGFTLLSGDDATALPLWSIGGEGAISVLSNVAPQAAATLWDSFAAGEWHTAQRIHHQIFPLVRALFVEANPIPIKAALEGLGRIHGELRLPMTPASEATRFGLEAALKAAGVLKQ